MFVPLPPATQIWPLKAILLHCVEKMLLIPDTAVHVVIPSVVEEIIVFVPAPPAKKKPLPQQSA